jgi:hypothetical protein
MLCGHFFLGCSILQYLMPYGQRFFAIIPATILDAPDKSGQALRANGFHNHPAAILDALWVFFQVVPFYTT